MEKIIWKLSISFEYVAHLHLNNSIISMQYDIENQYIIIENTINTARLILIFIHQSCRSLVVA